MATRRLKTSERGLGHRWQKLRLAILARDRYRCHWCGGRATTVDHLVPRALGGARYDPRNLVAACGPCNFRRGAQLGAERSRARAGRVPSTPRQVWAGAITLSPKQTP